MTTLNDIKRIQEIAKELTYIAINTRNGINQDEERRKLEQELAAIEERHRKSAA